MMSDEKTAVETPVTEPAEDTSSSLESAVRARYADLPESERRIADLILEFPGEIAAYSATELAELSGGSKAAVTRLVQRLGYSSFDEARRAARDAQAWGSPLYLMQREQPTKDFSGRVQAHIEQDVRNMSLTLQSLRPDVFGSIVEAICRSKRVYLIGWRNSYFLAGYLHWQIIQVRRDVHLLPSPGVTIGEELADLTDEDVLIVIGFRRRVPQLDPLMEAAHAAGARIVYVTDRSAEPSPHATWTVPCAVRGTDLFDRYAGAMSFLHFLAVSIAARTGSRGRKRLARIEELHEAFSQFNR